MASSKIGKSADQAAARSSKERRGWPVAKHGHTIASLFAPACGSLSARAAINNLPKNHLSKKTFGRCFSSGSPRFGSNAAGRGVWQFGCRAGPFFGPGRRAGRSTGKGRGWSKAIADESHILSRRPAAYPRHQAAVGKPAATDIATISQSSALQLEVGHRQVSRQIATSIILRKRQDSQR